MPIKFRCAYCNQLMGIARRKAGTVVRCPSCASQVTVPQPDADEPERAAADRPRKKHEEAAPIFERSDFDEIFNPAPAPSRKKRSEGSPFAFDLPDQPPAPELVDVYKKPEPVLPAPPSAPAPAAEKSAVPASPSPQGTAPRPGIWLTPGLATLLSVAAVVALALAFGAGLLVGIWISGVQPTDEKTSRAGDAGAAVWVASEPA